jgi:exonuclease SbcC
MLGDSDHGWEALLDIDTRQLELEFHDDETSNQWHIRLFWVYEDESKPDTQFRRKFERKTKSAIWQCVPRESLEEFLRPLEHSRRVLSGLNDEFERHALIQRVTGNGLGSLFD